MHKSILLWGLASALAGCAHDEASRSSAETPASAKVELPASQAAVGSTRAVAQLQPKSGNTTISGDVQFIQSTEGVQLELRVAGAPPGKHGAHIHEKGDCSDPEAKNAGIHWNPAGHKHGAPPPSSAHLGDLGNLVVSEDGKGTLELTSQDWGIGGGAANDVVGKSIVIHAYVDDLVTDPAGNSGARIACGVIH